MFKNRNSAAIGLLGILLAGCLTKNDNDTAGGSVVENEVIAGTILLADGTPAPNAEVKVYTVDHVPGVDPAPKRGQAETLVFATKTDAKGRYVLEGMAKGEYNILAKKGELASYQDSVFLSTSPETIDPDTLRTTGMLVGWVKLQPNHSPETVALQALGTNTFVNADAQGRFILGPLAEGRYSIRVVTTEAQYTPLFTSLATRSGHTDTLADTLLPVYTGIPVVTGLKASFDTLNGVATLTWNKVKYAHFQSYQVLRNQASDVVPALLPLASVTDTVYRDTLFLPDSKTGKDGTGPGSDSLIRSLQYRVKVVNQSDQIGLSYGKADLSAPSPFFVRMVLTLDGENRTVGRPLQGMRASVGDSLRLNLWFDNPTRKAASIRWYSGSSPDPIRSVVLDPAVRNGVVSLPYRTGDSAGTETIRVEVRDEAGTPWKKNFSLSVLEDAPLADAGADTTVQRGSLVKLHGRGADGLGRVVKWEWDIGGTGNFVTTSGPDTTFNAPTDFGPVLAVLRVTDDDGRQGLDSMQAIVALKWTEVPVQLSALFPGQLTAHQSVVFQGKLWNLGGLAPSFPSLYSPLNSASPDGLTWERMDSNQVFTNRAGHAALVFKDRLWVLGGRSLFRAGATDFRRGSSGDVWSSADGRTWDRVTADNFPGENGFAAVVFQGKLWSIGGASDSNRPDGVWSSEDGVTWTEAVSSAPLPPVQGHSAVVHGGKIWVIGGQDPVHFQLRTEIWSSSDGINWTAQPAPFGKIIEHRSLTYAGSLWVIGGYAGYYENPESEGSDDRFTRFNSLWRSSDGVSWQQMTIPKEVILSAGFSAVDFQGKLTLLFGLRRYNTFSDYIWQAE